MPDGELSGKTIYQVQAYRQHDIYTYEDQYLKKIRIHPRGEIIIYQKEKPQHQNYEDDFFKLHKLLFDIRFLTFPHPLPTGDHKGRPYEILPFFIFLFLYPLSDIRH